MAKLINTAGVTTVHHDGKTYKPDAKGVFTVPDGIVEALKPHGFAPAPLTKEGQEPAPDAKPAKAGKGKGDEAPKA